MSRSAFTSASVTRSAAEVFWRTSPSSSRRKRGMISAMAASDRSLASQSIAVSSNVIGNVLPGKGFVEGGEIEEFAIEQMRRPHIGHGVDHRVLAAGHALFQVVEHRLHRIALQAVL